MSRSVFGYSGRRAVSLMEITVVAAISSAILGSAMMIMGRTGRTFQKGSGMLNTQVLLDSITDRLQNDVRGLRSLVLEPDETKYCNAKTLTFKAFADGKNCVIKYQFDPEKKALYRIVKEPGGNLDDDGNEKYDFHGSGQVIMAFFEPSNSWKDFRYLNFVLQVNADFVKEEDRAKKAGSRLAGVCQFYPKSLEPLSSFVQPKKN